jgi:archaellum biogenesis ATPase FlaH
MRYSTGIEESLTKIFGGVTFGCLEQSHPMVKKIVSEGRINLARFRSTFLNNIFQDEYAIMYSMIVDKGLDVVTESMIEVILRNNIDLILDSPYVDLGRMLGGSIGSAEHIPTNDEKAEVIISFVLQKERELSNTYVTEEEYSSAVTVFIDWFKEQYMLEISQNMTLVMSDEGLSEKLPGKRKRIWKGSKDAKEYYSTKVKMLDNLTETKASEDVVINEEWLAKSDSTSGRNKNQRLMKLGIKEIDDYIGWMRRGNMLGILGPPKGGKTSISNYLVSEALDHGLNVCVVPLEGTKEEWLSKQKALRIKKDYDISVSSKVILELDFDGKEKDSEKIEITKGDEVIEIDKGAIRKIVKAAEVRMAVDEKLGRLSFLDGAMYMETLCEELDNHYNKCNPFDVVVIDSIVNIGSIASMSKSEKISNTYMNVKRYISKEMKLPALCIAPAQLKQESVDFLRKHPEATIEDTDGGESAETIRTPDEVIGIFSTKVEREVGMCKLYHVASRHSANFPDFYCGSDLKCSYFYSKPELNE